MFNFLKKKKKSFASPMTGTAIAITEVADPVFSGKLLGDGIAICPSSNDVLSPCDGIVTLVVDSLHSVAITSEDGIEVIIHLGLETVNLKGEGFKCFVKKGEKVIKGQKLIEMDIAFIKEKELDIVSPMIVLNMDKVKSFQSKTGQVIAGESEVIIYS